MNVCVFLGPTLSVASAREILTAEYLPPAGHGDIYRVAARNAKPRAIGLIDGTFRHQPAVRHKEILWALSHGIHVFGAASMGALRAAELADFGMIGVGGIYEAFRNGLLEDDDEVAVDHGPPELNYPALNEAMIDVRAKLSRARAEGVISDEVDALLVEAAKDLFYADRSWVAIIEKVEFLRESSNQITRLSRWLKQNLMGQKAADAEAMLRAIGAFLAGDPAPHQPGFTLNSTEHWQADVSRWR